MKPQQNIRGWKCLNLPVILHNLIQPIDQWLLGRHLGDMTSEWKPLQLLLEIRFIQVERLG